MTAEVKERILAHMTRDHASSLRLYIQDIPDGLNYWLIGPRQPVAKDISNEALIIALPSMVLGLRQHEYRIPFDPPLHGLSEARQRLVELDQRARRRLEVHDVDVDRFTPPGAFGRIVFCYVLAVLTIFASRGNFIIDGEHMQSRSSLSVYKLLRMDTWPVQIHHFCYAVQPYLMALILIVHTLEAAYVIFGRFRKHSLPFMSRLWCRWTVQTLVEGIGSILRFDALVRSSEMKKAKAAKH